jgi:hypothetical protein
MNLINWIERWFLGFGRVLCLATIFAALGPLDLTVCAQEGAKPTPTAKPAEPPGQADSAKDKPKPAPKKLSGAELYSMHCNRCHPERYPTERTAAQWKTILLHMRVRANLPAEQSRTILRYLQDNSGR